MSSSLTLPLKRSIEEVGRDMQHAAIVGVVASAEVANSCCIYSKFERVPSDSRRVYFGV